MAKKKSKTQEILDGQTELANRVASLDAKFDETISQEPDGLKVKVVALQEIIRGYMANQKTITENLQRQINGIIKELKDPGGIEPRLRKVEMAWVATAAKLALLLSLVTAVVQILLKQFLG